MKLEENVRILKETLYCHYAIVHRYLHTLDEGNQNRNQVTELTRTRNFDELLYERDLTAQNLVALQKFPYMKDMQRMNPSRRN